MDKNYNENIINNFRFLCKQKKLGLGQAEVSCGVTPGYISRVETKEGEPSLSFIIRASEVFNTTIDSLVKLEFSSMSKENLFVSNFLSKILSDTNDEKISWHKYDVDYFENKKILIPMPSFFGMLTDKINNYTSLYDGENYDIDVCAKFTYKNVMYCFYKFYTTDPDLVSFYDIDLQKRNDHKSITRITDTSPLYETMNDIFSAIDDYLFKNRIPQDVKDTMKVFMDDEDDEWNF